MKHSLTQSSLEEETEDPELIDEQDRAYGGVRLKPLEDESVPNEPYAEGDEVFDFALIEAFLSLTDGLHLNPMIEQVTRDLNRAVPEVTLRLVEDGLGTRLDDQTRSLYRQIDGMEFRWHGRDAEGRLRLGGALQIVPFLRTFGLWLDELWPTEEPSESASQEELSDYQARWQLRGFDMPEGRAEEDPGAAPLWAMFSLDERHPGAYTLHAYHPESGDFLKLDLSLIDYLYCALGACGAPGWQLLFCDYDFSADPWEMGAPQTWIERVSRVFPTFDVTFFKARLAGLPRREEE